MEPTTLQEAIIYFADPRQLPDVFSRPSLAEWCRVPPVRKQERVVLCDLQSLAMWKPS